MSVQLYVFNWNIVTFIDKKRQLYMSYQQPWLSD